MAMPPTPPVRPIDPHFVERMNQYWREEHEPTPPQGGTFNPLDFPLVYPDDDPFGGQGGYYLPSPEDAPWDPTQRPTLHQPAGPLNPYRPDYPHGGFLPRDWGDWGNQQYPYNPIDYEAPWNVGPYESWPGYIPAQPWTPEWDYLWEGPFAGGSPMQPVAQMGGAGQMPMQQMPNAFQGVPYGQQLQGLEGYF